MPQMERNVNLEEIGADPLFGLDGFKYQSIKQKALFTICTALGVFSFLGLSVLLEKRAFGTILAALLFFVGVSGGLNYGPGMSYGKYLILLFLRPRKVLTYQSTESLLEVRKKAAEGKKEEERILKNAVRAADHKKEGRKFIGLFVLIIMIVIGIMAAGGLKEDPQHHEAFLEVETNDTGK